MKRPIDTRLISKSKSNLFEIVAVDEKPCIPNMNWGEWQYLHDEQVMQSITHNGPSDFTLAITEYALEDNFYMRRISTEICVVSLFEVGDSLQYHNIPLENFIIVNIYRMVALLKIYTRLPLTSEGIPHIIHDETRSCLFDMNGLKADIIYSITRPNLCQPCKTVMMESQLPHGFLSTICKELKSIRKPMYYRLQDYIKKNPLASIAIMVFSALIIEVLANAVCVFIPKIWNLLHHI